jgi:hypothetical protein
MAINFPNSPTVNQTFTEGSTTWFWSGTVWEIQPITSPSFTSLSTSGNASIGGNLAVSGIINGTVNGTVSNISNHNLDDLGDVVTGTPANGDVLNWSSANSRWEPIQFGGFSGGTVTNPIFVSNATASSNSSTGALRVTGGVGITDDLYIGGHVVIEDEFLRIGTRGELRFSDSDNTNYVGFKAATNVSSNIIWTLPDTDGDVGQFLRTNGAGVLSWATAAGGGEGGSTPPGGSNTQVQYNDSGSFGGNANFTFNLGTTTLNVPTLIGSGIATFSNSTASTSSTTGAVKVTGGVGIQGQLNVAGATNKFTASTASSSTTTGAVVITGGLGIGGQIYVGSNVNITTAPTLATHAVTKSYVDSNSLAFAIAFGV